MFSESSLIGSIIDGKYTILAEIGRGGMGSVYKARESGLERDVALKVMNTYHLNDADSRARFEREGKVLSSLQHRHIMAIYRLGFWNDHIPYLSMEYLSGKTLRQVMDEESKLSVERTLHIAIQLCQALEYAHSHGVIHRDIKPGNIMLLNEPEIDFVKLVDFGLMKLLPESGKLSQKLTQTGLLIGTAQYLSPEQCQGKHADKQSDLYSLACIVYECIAGVPVFEVDNPIGLIHKHANEMPQPLPVSNDLNLVLQKALQKDPALRFQSANEFSEALNKIQLGTPLNQNDYQNLLPWSSSSTDPIKKQNNTPFIAVAIVSLFLVLFFWLKSWQETKPALSLKTAITPTERILNDAEKTSLEAIQFAHQNQMTRAVIQTIKTLELLGTIDLAAKLNQAEQTKERAILTRIHAAVTMYQPQSFAFRFPGRNHRHILDARYAANGLNQERVLLHKIGIVEAESQQEPNAVFNNRRGLFNTYLTYDLKKAKSELDYLDAFLHEHKQEADPKKADLLYDKAKWSLHSGKSKKEVARHLQSALASAKTADYQTDFFTEMSFLSQIADLAKQIDDRHTLNQLLPEAKKISEETKKDPKQITSLLLALAMSAELCVRQHNYKEALKYYREDEKIRQSFFPKDNPELIALQRQIHYVESLLH
ncbi:MAG: serine/threonine protein kinase [Candidatus Obscuribacterales bacterium]|nr:serine/threonine protein kinase [Candidatus Obscuribacterales bacterium]